MPSTNLLTLLTDDEMDGEDPEAPWESMFQDLNPT
jgi:hypothetical protein